MASPGTVKIADIQVSATVDWSPLGDIYVKKYVNYNLDWQVNLSEHLVAIAPYGGPVALFPKGTGRAGVKKSHIVIYTLAGRKIVTIPVSEFDMSTLLKPRILPTEQCNTRC